MTKTQSIPQKASAGLTGAKFGAASLLAASLLTGGTETLQAQTFYGERATFDHVSNTNLWQNVGAIESFNYVDQPTNSCVAWIQVNPGPNEKVGHVGFVGGLVGADGTLNGGTITNCVYDVIGPVTNVADANLSALAHPIVTLPSPCNSDYQTQIGNFLGIKLTRYDFDLSSLNITNSCLIAVVPRSTMPISDVVTVISFATGGTNSIGTNSNVFVIGPGLGAAGPATLAQMGGYPGNYFACFATAVPVATPQPEISFTRAGNSMTLSWPPANNPILQSTTDLSSGVWENVSVPAGTNSYTVPDTTVEPMRFFRLKIAL